jgi:transcriptional regulator with XRE-family HTH domain
MKNKGYQKFKAFLAENDIKQKEIADLICVTESTISKKINGQADFDMREVRTICNKYNIKADIFLH